MEDRQLKALYKSACDAKNYIASDGQFKSWKAVLGWCDEDDLRRAIDAYWAANTAFPMPAELRTLAEIERRIRVTSTSTKHDFIVWWCALCKTTRSGWPSDGGAAPRYCLGVPKDDNTPVIINGTNCCGYTMQIIKRESVA